MFCRPSSWIPLLMRESRCPARYSLLELQDFATDFFFLLWPKTAPACSGQCAQNKYLRQVLDRAQGKLPKMLKGRKMLKGASGDGCLEMVGSWSPTRIQL